MASMAPLGPDDSIATQLLIPCGTLQVVVVVLYVARMYARLRLVPKLWLDDYTISLATAISITGYALQIMACKHGMGRHNAYLTSKEQAAALHYLFGLYSIWVVGVGLVRVSVACTLLRVWDVKAWRWTLWALIIVQMLSVTSTFIAQFTECRPLRAMWDVVPGAKCWTPAQMHTFGYVFAITNIALDFSLSLMPIAFLRRLRRPLSERIVIAFLMALGLVASAAAIIKTSYMRDFAITGDTLRDIVHINMWCKIEEQLGIVAVCIPPLRSLSGHVLRELGLPTFSSRTRGSDYYWTLKYSTNRSHILGPIDRHCGHVDASEGAKVNVHTVVLPPKAHTAPSEDESGGQKKTQLTYSEWDGNIVEEA